MSEFRPHALKLWEAASHSDEKGSAESIGIPALATVKQAYTILNCSRTKLFDLLNQGVLERRKIGRATRVTVASIQQLVGNPTCEGRQ